MPAEAEQSSNQSRRHFEPNTVSGTLIVAVVLCLICSLVVSSSAVVLKPLQQKNQRNKMQRNVLIAAGIWDADKYTDADIPELFKHIETVEVTLPAHEADLGGAPAATDNAPEMTGDFAGSGDEPIEVAAGTTKEVTTVSIPKDLDLAGIKERPKAADVYLVKNDQGKVQSIVLPIYGKGLWSTLYGFLALEGDGRTVKGITYYQQGETPGLGGEVENPTWKAQWPEKVAIDENGHVILDVTKPGYAESDNEVDGLSGATITSNGVESMIRYWLGSDGFGPFLAKYREGKIANK